MAGAKRIIWMGTSLDDLKALPDEPKRAIGFALSAVQDGGFPRGAKPLHGVSGVYELRISTDTSTYRAVYVVNLGDHIYVLHVFQKKSKKGVATPQAEMNLIRARLKLAREAAQDD